MLAGREQSPGTQNSGAQAGQHYARTVATYEWDDRGTRTGNRAQDIWVAYPTSQMQENKTYTISAAAAWKMTEADPARSPTSSERVTS